MKDWVSDHPEGAVLHVIAQPKASRSEFVGLYGDSDRTRIKVRIAAPPIEGEANEELLHYLRKALKPIGLIRVSLVRGEQSRQKDLLCTGLSAPKLRTAIESLLRK